MAIIPYYVIITGDLISHVDNKSDVNAHRGFSILDSQKLTYHANGTIHKGGHTKDLIIA